MSFSVPNGFGESQPNAWSVGGMLILTQDNTIIATAIPKITDHFKALDDVGWYGSGRHAPVLHRSLTLIHPSPSLLTYRMCFTTALRQIIHLFQHQVCLSDCVRIFGAHISPFRANLES